jgi:adenylate kinase
MRLRAERGIPHIGSGDALRAMAHGDTPLAAKIRSYMEQGQYLPDDLMIDVMLSRLQQPDTLDGFILDGFPRTVSQAETLDRAMEDDGRKLDLALLISVPADLVVGRLTGRIICPNCNAIYNTVTKPPQTPMRCDVCGHELVFRSDETPEVIHTRLEVYERETRPLVDFYRDRGILAEVDGSGDASDVAARIDAVLDAQPIEGGPHESAIRQSF